MSGQGAEVCCVLQVLHSNAVNLFSFVRWVDRTLNNFMYVPLFWRTGQMLFTGRSAAVDESEKMVGVCVRVFSATGPVTLISTSWQDC